MRSDWTRDRLISTKELSQALGVAEISIYKWHKQPGGPPGFKIKGCLRFRWGEILDWLEKNRSGPAR